MKYLFRLFPSLSPTNFFSLQYFMLISCNLYCLSHILYGFYMLFSFSSISKRKRHKALHSHSHPNIYLSLNIIPKKRKENYECSRLIKYNTKPLPTKFNVSRVRNNVCVLEMRCSVWLTKLFSHTTEHNLPVKFKGKKHKQRKRAKEEF